MEISYATLQELGFALCALKKSVILLSPGIYSSYYWSQGRSVGRDVGGKRLHNSIVAHCFVSFENTSYFALSYFRGTSNPMPRPG